jgi:hypothetical protein
MYELIQPRFSHLGSFKKHHTTLHLGIAAGPGNVNLNPAGENVKTAKHESNIEWLRSSNPEFWVIKDKSKPCNRGSASTHPLRQMLRGPVSEGATEALPASEKHFGWL